MFCTELILCITTPNYFVFFNRKLFYVLQEEIGWDERCCCCCCCLLLPLLCLLSWVGPTASSVSWLELVLQPQLGIGSPSGPVGQGASSPGGPGAPRSPFRPRFPFLPGSPSLPVSPCSPRSPFSPGIPSSPARPSCPASPFSPTSPGSPWKRKYFSLFFFSDGSFENKLSQTKLFSLDPIHN